MKNIIPIFTFVFLAATFVTIKAQSTKIIAADGQAGDHFGNAVSISGDYAIVGAAWEDEKGNYAGSAYIFMRNGNTWQQQAKLTAADGEAMDFFGEAVSLSDSFAVVGASGDDDKGNYAGAAYIFKRTGETWTQLQKLTAADGAERDYFGKDVSISGDYALVGAYSDADSGSASGSAYIFKRDGNNWVQQAKLLGEGEKSSDWFGRSVSICGDYAIIGAFGDGDNELDAAGAAYIFKRDGEQWTQQAKLIADDRAYNDLFGRFVSICGDYAIVGAYWDDDKGNNSGSAYIFKRDGELWTQQTKITADDGKENGYFGGSVSISGDYAAIGTYVDEDATGPIGSAYLFKRDGNSWAQYSKLTDEFGGPVSINAANVIVGAWWGNDNGEASGLAYVHNVAGTRPNNPPFIARPLADQVRQTNFPTYTAANLDTVFSDPDGDHLIFSATNDYGITVTINDSLLELSSIQGFAGICRVKVTASDTGYSVVDSFTVTVEGNILSLTPSSQNVGAASVRTSFYVANTGPGQGLMDWSAVSNDPWLTIVRGDSGTNDGLVTVSHGSNPGAPRSGSITVTANGAMNSPQTVEITQASGLTKGEYKIVASDGNENDNFGASVCISGNYLIAGACSEDMIENKSGSAYIFEFSLGSWTQQAKLVNDGTMLSDRFGDAVSISGDYAIAGACRDSVNGYASGAAYVFKRDGGLWIRQIKLTAADGEKDDTFGGSVSICGDYAIVGAENDDDNGQDAGAAYIFIRDSDNWIQQDKLLAEDGEKYDFFGGSVSISGDYAVVGAEGVGQTGAAYIFKRNGENWIQQAKLIDNDSTQGDHFGESVSISGNYAIIGASWGGDNRSGSAYVFERNGDSWTQQTKLTADDAGAWDYFGKSVSISGDYAIMGSSWDDDKGWYSGSAYIFKRNGSSWSQFKKLVASDGAVRDFFGRSVSVFKNHAVVGSYLDDDNGNGSGSAYIYNIDTSGTGIHSSEEIIPSCASLFQNYPNPFNPTTVIRYRLNVSDNVQLSIYNVLGKKICILVNKRINAGEHRVIWDGKDDYKRNLASGIYFYRLTIGKLSLVKKMLYLR